MTTPTKHTPGPWHIIHEPTLSTYHIRVEDLDAAPVASLFYSSGGSRPQSLFYSSGGSRPQLSRELIDANARLIAAAPDLLAACEAIMPHLDSDLDAHEPWVKEISAMAAAIAKAKGGAA